MGVHGLWKLLEPSGQMVPLESLAGKVLAVDVSIWLHQAVKGMHDTYGAPVAAAHIIILLHRLCKLLFYKIKPVFVFDGGVPALKHSTMAARRHQTSNAKFEAQKVREKLIKNLLKHEAVRQVLSNEAASAVLGLNSFALPGPSVEEDLYKLPPIAADYADDSSVEEEGQPETDEENEKFAENIHSIDVTSKEFLSLPPEVRHDILTELIETRKQNSWKYLDTMPKNSDSFSDFQMSRLLKRHAVQVTLEKTGKEMGGRPLSLKELETILGSEGVIDVNDDLPGKRIAQDSTTRYLLIQKDSDGQLVNDGEVTEARTSTEKFDIMKRLDDVEWSSDSDTDIILQRTSKLPKTSFKELEKKQMEEDNKNVLCIKTEPTAISRKPKVQMTKELADILSILEEGDSEDKNDLDVGYKEKVRQLQNKFGMNNGTVTIKQEVDEDAQIKNTIKVEPEDVKQSIANILEGDSENEELEETKSLLEENSGFHKNSKAMSPPEEKDDLQKHAVLKSTKEIPSLTPQEIKIENVAEETNNFSSSDSESDFIPIKVTDSESTANNEVEKKEVNSLINSSNGGNKEDVQVLSIRISSSKTCDDDDIFADVFQPSSESKVIDDKEVTQEEEIKIMEVQKEEEGAEEITDNKVAETTKCETSIESYKVEFEGHAEKLTELKKSLEENHRDLILEQGNQERHALNPTDQMYTDAQELLKLFGIPFVIAPMEAEAQCAILDTLGLTEGTITDDSDIWLFGGTVVYKNFFNQKKHVLEYTSLNIQKYFKLGREDLIRIAMLVGSDYTVGLNGIGPVTALEILAAFPSAGHGLFEGLENFRDWFTGKCKTGLPRTKLKKKIKNTVISSGFPNRAVAEAYLHPHVDDSKEPFSWAKPNLDLIRQYIKMKIGWSSEKCNELLLPVLKKIEENTSQSIMEKYFKIVPKDLESVKGLLSKRVESAIKRLGGNNDDIDDEDGNVGSGQEEPKLKKKRKTKENPRDGRSLQKSDNIKQSKARAKKQKLEDKSDLIFEKPKVSAQTSNEKYIKEKLHREEKIPQKEITQKLLEERKRQAIEIFRTFKRKGKKKTKVFAKKEANLSESSSEND